MPAKLNTDEFIERAKLVYGDRYDYSKSIYLGIDKPIDIICKKHGIFHVRAHNFLKGHGCPVCSNRQRINTAVFIERATEIHNGRYDYSRVDCKGGNSYVKIICPVHGEFTQKAEYHLNGNGCPKCFGTPKSNTEEFVKKAQTIYGDKYDYSKSVYNGNKTKLIVTCKKHGDWLVTPNNFLRGSECPKCYGTPKYTTEQFIKKAREVHGAKYSYSKVEYKGNKYKVRIICPIHGDFLQNADSHLRGAGCPVCNVGYRVMQKSGESVSINKDIFLKKSRESHVIEYDYSQISFSNCEGKICIICPIHGEFWQNPGYHMRGGNCPKCAGSYKLTTKEFVEKAKKVHGDKYDYSKVEYKNYSTKVCVVCPIHGEFWQSPNSHLFGAGCPVCPQSNMEGELREVLLKRHIKFEQEKTFPWLKFKRKMFLDFYLPEFNAAIECQGGQHFAPVDLFGGEEFYDKTIKRDKAKHDLCEKHGIKIFYFSKSADDYIYPVYSSYNDLIKAIKG